MNRIHINLRKDDFIDVFEDGTVTVKCRKQYATDSINNYILAYFDIPLGEVCFVLENFSRKIYINFEGYLKKEDKEAIIEFKQQMNELGLFQNRKRMDILYKQTQEEKMLHEYVMRRILVIQDGEPWYDVPNPVIQAPEQVNMTDAPKLISCPCCGKKVSNQATACPDCGQPIAFSHIYQANSRTTANALSDVKDNAIICPKCNSRSVSIVIEKIVTGANTKTELRKKSALRNAGNAIGRGAMIAATGGLWGLTPKKSTHELVSSSKNLVQDEKQAVCQNCGYHWIMRY